MTYTPIAALPTAPNPGDPGTFNTRAANWVAALSTWTTNANNLAGWINQQAIQMPTGTGGIVPLIGNISVTDNTIVTGFYSYDTGLGSSGAPAGVVRASLLHTRRGAGGGETQMLVVESSVSNAVIAGTAWTRSRVAGAWSDWRPPGIVDSSSNANGRYVRHQDGTQICWQGATSSTSADVSAAFPAAFASTTDLRTTISINSTALSALSPRFTNRTTTGLQLSVFNTSNARVATAVEIVTVGRWF